jgi:hypothetical protein
VIGAIIDKKAIDLHVPSYEDIVSNDLRVGDRSIEVTPCSRISSVHIEGVVIH